MIASVATPELRAAIGDVDGVEVVLWDGSDEAATPDPRIEFCVPDYRRTRPTLHRLAQLPALQVVQTQLAGFDGQPELLPPGVTLCNATGVHDDATAEHAVGLILASQRQIPDAVRHHGHWQQPPQHLTRALADSRVLVLGYGSIGRALAVRLLAMKAVVTAVASRTREDDLVGPVRSPDELAGLLPDQHVLVVLLPLNEGTRGYVGRDLLGRLPDGALVVNVARGGVLDNDSVLAEAGRLRFALDVTDPEPLPDGHPLWEAPEVLITPHVAGGTTAMLPRIAALVRDQLQRHVAGDPLRNIVATT